MDLLTTVIHELGNAMGFAEDQGQDVSGATLQAGVRRIPVAAAAPGLSADDPAITVSVVSNLPATNSSNGVGLAGDPLITAPVVSTLSVAAGDPLNKVALGQPIILPITVAPAATNPNGTPLNVVAAGTLVLPGIAPSITVSVGGTVCTPPVSGPFEGIDPVPSFVSLDPGTAPASQVISADPPAADRPSSLPINQGGGKPTINWDNTIDGLGNSSSAPAAGSPEWLDDFLNHLGQSQAQRNPNAGIRLRP
jgi:hypothetical protein